MTATLHRFPKTRSTDSVTHVHDLQNQLEDLEERYRVLKKIAILCAIGMILNGILVTIL